MHSQQYHIGGRSQHFTTIGVRAKVVVVINSGQKTC